MDLKKKVKMKKKKISGPNLVCKNWERDSEGVSESVIWDEIWQVSKHSLEQQQSKQQEQHITWYCKMKRAGDIWETEEDGVTAIQGARRTLAAVKPRQASRGQLSQALLHKGLAFSSDLRDIFEGF